MSEPAKKKFEDMTMDEIFSEVEEELLDGQQSQQLSIYHLVPGSHREARAVALVVTSLPEAEA